MSLVLLIDACQPVAQPLEHATINKRGVHLLLDDGRQSWPPEQWVDHMDYAAELTGPGGYVTQLVRSDDLNLQKWQLFFDLCAERELIPIIRLATTFDQEAGYWEAPPPDEDGRYHGIGKRYADFLAGLNWPSGTKLVIVGNEPNHGNEWSGRPDPAAYARFFVDVASALHRADPEMQILNAGFDTYTPDTGDQPFNDGFYYVDAERFINEMVQAEPNLFTHLDGWVSHPYPMGPFARPPWEQHFQIDRLNGSHNPAHRPPPAGIPNRGVNGYEWEIWLLAQYGVKDLPIYITETGWRHSLDGYPDLETAALYFELAWRGNRDGRFAAYPAYPTEGWTPWQDDLRVVAVTPFALGGHPVEWAHSNWLIIDDEGIIEGSTPLFDQFRHSSE